MVRWGSENGPIVHRVGFLLLPPTPVCISAHALPAACIELMTREDSPIGDFYPTKLKFDPNGKKFAWQWIVLLPFIDEVRLVAAMKPILVRTGLFSL